MLTSIRFCVQVLEPKRNYKKHFEALSGEVGLTDSFTLPSRDFSGATGGERMWRIRTVRHISKVIEGRGIANILDAIKRAGYFDQLLDVPEVRRAGIMTAVKAFQDRWSPRLMVHLWDRLDLSRTGCELLRHVLSFRYAPDRDHYDKLKVWTNPHDENDSIDFPCLPGRTEREREYNALAETCGICVSDTGNCQRDASTAASDLYSNYKSALRKIFTRLRPAMPLFMFDGTGQSLGRGLCHAELGSADFAANDCMQSRSTLQPLQAAEGDDHAISIRDSMLLTTQSYNKLIKAAEIELHDGTAIPAKPIATADMKAVKALTATAEDSTHSVWCKCLAHEGRQHRYCSEPIPIDNDSPESVEAAYEKMIAYIETDPMGPKCQWKTYDGQCCSNHMPPSVARGGPFKRFKCEDCGYAPTAAEWRRDYSGFNALTSAQQKAKRKEHMTNGQIIYKWNRHHFGTLFMTPMLFLDFKDIGVDQLHLVYLNCFKHLFNYTIHQPMPGAPCP